MLIAAKALEYKPLPSVNEDRDGGEEPRIHPTRPLNRKITVSYILCFIISLITAFIAGVLLGLDVSSSTSTHNHESGTSSSIPKASRIPLPQITGEFVHQSLFSVEPPLEGNVSEPIWDALIPNGLGYFNAPGINTSKPNSSSVVIPSAFHQLHCLYLLRRAYYTATPESELQRFDFGRNRSVHVAHCFDYLAQTITCLADGTLEPAVDKERGFLGSGFARRCWDFEYLKNFVEERRVFNASGFLAWGTGKDGKVELA
ncbi:hypothetical protein BDV11DRAFT_213887 [Aspergillus similis]